MTVLSELSKIAYIGSSSQTLYPIPFEYINTDDVKVSIYTSNNEFVEDWTYSVQYVIEGGNVKVLSGYNIDNTKKLLILRMVDLVQDNKYREGGDFPAKSTETSFDKLTMITQQLQETLDRCVKVEVLDNQTPEELLQTVYDKLDSATVIAGDAINAANQAQTAADNATAAVNSAEQTLANVTAYVDSAKVEINNTKNTDINTINSTVTQAKADINTAVSNAESNISTIVSDAEGSITNIAVTEANKAIANAAQEATDMATANLNSYVDGTVKPSLQTYVDQAQEDANSAATSMQQAALSATAASNYASNASADADNAANSAGLAANSAGAAKVSEGKAAEYLQQIGNKITNVEGSIGDIGIAPLGIDETQNKRRYLNGQVISQAQFVSFTNKIKAAIQLTPSLATSETNWQAEVTNSKLGQCGKFVIDDTAGTIRLPKVVNIQGLQDLSLLGGIKAESLPNITGELGINAGDNTTGAFGFIRNAFGYTLNDNNNDYRTTFNASRSSSTYQDNAPVQQEAVQYPYFIQVATGSETENNIINDIELNNPYSLFDSKYSDHELNNLSWLKSEGQWNAKATYPTAYDKLLKVYNGTETVEGLSVKLSTETYTDYDFVLNTADETFRLPLLDGSESLPSETKIKQTFGTDFNLPYNAFVWVSAYSSDANSDGVLKVILPGDTVTHTIWQHDTGYNIYTSPLMPKGTKVITSGGTGYLGVGYHKAQGNGSLYYYVGETVQNANLIDAGRIGEQLATKTDILQASGAGMPSNKYIDLTLGASGSTYIAPANGYILFDQQLNSGMGMWVSIFDSNNNYLYGYATTSAVTSGTCITLPIKKNYKYTVNYTGGTKNRFRFIYAEGEQ